jgi:hypothetical protein
MTFDEQHGWVERGTRGVHSGAVVRDVGAEIALLDKLSRESYHDGYWWPGTPRAMRARLLEMSLQYHANQRDGLREAQRRTSHDTLTRRLAASGYVIHKLALLAPYIAVLRAGEAKRAARAARGETT